MDYNIKLENGLVLRGMIFNPRENLKAMIVFVHGLGEHIHRYDSWAAMLNEKGFGFTGVDLPGHGLSDGPKGFIRNYSVTDEMISVLITNVKNTFPGVPLFIYGHSLGGGIVLDYLLRKSPDLRGAVVTSPWLRLSFEPSKFKLGVASIMKSIMPGLIQPSGLVVEHISHVPEVVERYKTDKLVHDKISVSLFNSAMSAASFSLAHAGDLKIPLLLMHGSDDQICSPQGSQEFASKAPGAELKIWQGGYHELHNETFRTEVFEYLVNWLNTRL